MKIKFFGFILMIVACSIDVARAEPKERHLSSPPCYPVVISEISARLEGADPQEVGTQILYSNGVVGTSYEYVPQISERSIVGDPVKLCLVSEFVGCPAGDHRGKTYKAKNLRTGEHWELANSQHICGGA